MYKELFYVLIYFEFLKKKTVFGNCINYISVANLFTWIHGTTVVKESNISFRQGPKKGALIGNLVSASQLKGIVEEYDIFI